MKTLALTLLIPLVVCTACSKADDSYATEAAPAAAADRAPANAPASATASGTANASANAPAMVAPAETGPATARVTLISAAGSSVKGDLTLTNDAASDGGSSVNIRGEITGLTPGKEHGFHVHEFGACTAPDFKSAGEHFNPTMEPHAGPKGNARHLGDIENAKADKDGRASIDLNVRGVTLGDKDAGPAEIFGKSLVVHAMPDDYKTQPSGGSGARVACGVIQ